MGSLFKVAPARGDRNPATAKGNIVCSDFDYSTFSIERNT